MEFCEETAFVDFQGDDSVRTLNNHENGSSGVTTCPLEYLWQTSKCCWHLCKVDQEHLVLHGELWSKMNLERTWWKRDCVDDGEVGREWKVGGVRGWRTPWGESTRASPIWFGKTKTRERPSNFVKISDGAAPEHEKSHWSQRAKLLQNQEGYHEFLKCRNQEMFLLSQWQVSVMATQCKCLGQRNKTVLGEAFKTFEKNSLRWGCQ